MAGKKEVGEEKDDTRFLSVRTCLSMAPVLGSHSSQLDLDLATSNAKSNEVFEFISACDGSLLVRPAFNAGPILFTGPAGRPARDVQSRV